MCSLRLLWSGSSNLENITLIYKPDQMKIETLIVHGPCIFSAFAISFFSCSRYCRNFWLKRCHATFQSFEKPEKLRNNDALQAKQFCRSIIAICLEQIVTIDLKNFFLTSLLALYWPEKIKI